MSHRKKPQPTPARLVEPFQQGEYKMPADLKIAALRAQHQPPLLSVNSKIKPNPQHNKGGK